MAEIKAGVEFTGKDNLSRTLQNIDKNMAGFNRTMKKSTTTSNKINKSLKKTEKTTAKLSATMKKAVGVFAAFFAVKAIKGLIDIGGAMSDVSAAADEMLERFDLTVNTALPLLRAATRGLVTDLDLLKASNQLLASGLGDQLEGFEDVAAIMDLVDRRATATGVSFEKLWKQFLSGAKNAKIGSDNTVRAILNLDKTGTIMEGVADKLTKSQR